jgi:hypothetical protein
VYPLRLPSWVRLSPLSKSRTCYIDLGLWLPNTVHSCTGIKHINWTSSHFQYMLKLLVTWEFPDGLSGSPMDCVNPAYKWTPSPLCSQEPSLYAIVWAHMPVAVGVCLLKLNWVGTDGFISSFSNWMQLSSQFLSVIIDKGSRETCLLASLEHSGLLYFPYGASTQSVIAAPHLDIRLWIDESYR